MSPKEAALVGRALQGIGGVGKTRLAIEYAYMHAADYSALLFVGAEDPSALTAGLAGLAAVLDLPEQEARQDTAKIGAVMRWLEANPTWLLILDNVNDEKAIAAVNGLMSELKGGHVIMTARLSNFGASVRNLELDALDEDAATQFLLSRTAEDRERAQDDEAQARALARELGGLPLALELAGADISKTRINIATYLARAQALPVERLRERLVRGRWWVNGDGVMRCRS
jgi:predicted ATPase